jgi:hypothetical protein
MGRTAALIPTRGRREAVLITRSDPRYRTLAEAKEAE